MPYAWGTTGLCYRSDLVKAEPTSWNDLLKPSDDVKGKTTMLATDRWLLGAGFLAQGFSVNETDAAKLDAGQDLLIEAKKTLLAYDDTTFYSKLVSGEAVLVQAWDGWCNYGITENKAIKYVVPKEGCDLWVDTMVIVASSQDKDAAHAFINFVLDADNGNGWPRTSSTRCRTRRRWSRSTRRCRDLPESRHGPGRPHQVRAAARCRRCAKGLHADRHRDHRGAVEPDPMA